MKRTEITRHGFGFRIAALLMLAGATFLSGNLARAEDDIVILDEPSSASDSEELTIGGSEEVSLDLEAGSEDFFNPYVFDRDPKWMLLPLLSLVLVGLHLLPVPKAKKRKLVAMTAFFRHASQRRQGAAPPPAAVGVASAAKGPKKSDSGGKNT